MSQKTTNLKRNRISLNVEDSILEGVTALAIAEGLSTSELIRQLIVTELRRVDLLPVSTIERLAGVRD